MSGALNLSFKELRVLDVELKKIFYDVETEVETTKIKEIVEDPQKRGFKAHWLNRELFEYAKSEFLRKAKEKYPNFTDQQINFVSGPFLKNFSVYSPFGKKTTIQLKKMIVEQ